MVDMKLTRATELDIPFVMSTERQDGYHAVVGPWDESTHQAALHDGRHTYFIGYVNSGPVGFAILRDWASADQVTLVKRLAVRNPGQRYGRLLLSLVVEAAFQQTDVHRLWLGVIPENLRARRAYEAVGFVAEELHAEAAFPAASTATSFPCQS